MDVKPYHIRADSHSVISSITIIATSFALDGFSDSKKQTNPPLVSVGWCDHVRKIPQEPCHLGIWSAHCGTGWDHFTGSLQLDHRLRAYCNNESRGWIAGFKPFYESRILEDTWSKNPKAAWSLATGSHSLERVSIYQTDPNSNMESTRQLFYLLKNYEEDMWGFDGVCTNRCNMDVLSWKNNL